MILINFGYLAVVSIYGFRTRKRLQELKNNYNKRLADFFWDSKAGNKE